MKLTVMLGLFTIFMLCVVEETTAHASGGFTSKVISDIERRKKQQERARAKKERAQQRNGNLETVVVAT